MRLNNSESCYVCARRACGLAVGNAHRRAWYCEMCTIELAVEAINMNLDPIEKQTIVNIAEKAGKEVTLTGEDVNAFIEWVIQEYSNGMRLAVNNVMETF